MGLVGFTYDTQQEALDRDAQITAQCTGFDNWSDVYTDGVKFALIYDPRIDHCLTPEELAGVIDISSWTISFSHE